MSDAEQRPVVGSHTRPPSAAALPPKGRYVTLGADVEIIDGHLKVARGGPITAEGPQSGSQQFEFYSDEPPHLGGEGSHPQPLLYIAAGVGF